MLDGDLAFRRSLRHEIKLDRSRVGPGDAHRFTQHPGANRKLHTREPAPADPRMLERALQPSDRHGEHLALAGLVGAAAALADGAESLDPLVTHRHGLGPPVGNFVALVDVLRYLAVGPLVGGRAI